MAEVLKMAPGGEEMAKIRNTVSAVIPDTDIRKCVWNNQVSVNAGYNFIPIYPHRAEKPQQKFKQMLVSIK